MDKKAAARAYLIGEIDKVVGEYSEALERVSNVLLGAGFIVMTGGTAVKFEMKGKVANKPSTTRVDLAPRFTKRDAEMLAAEVTNGKGEKGRAVHIREALMSSIEELVELKTSIKARA